MNEVIKYLLDKYRTEKKKKSTAFFQFINFDGFLGR